MKRFLAQSLITAFACIGVLAGATACSSQYKSRITPPVNSSHQNLTLEQGQEQLQKQLGSYQTLEKDSAEIDNSGQTKCDQSSIAPETESEMDKDQVAGESYVDPHSHQHIPSTTLSVQTGFVNGACTTEEAKIFSDRGYWSSDTMGLHYRYSGMVVTGANQSKLVHMVYALDIRDLGRGEILILLSLDLIDKTNIPRRVVSYHLKRLNYHT